MSRQFHIDNDIDYDGNQLPAGEEFTDKDYYKSMEIDFTNFILEVAAYFRQPLPREHSNLKLLTGVFLHKYGVAIPSTSIIDEKSNQTKEELIDSLRKDIEERIKNMDEFGPDLGDIGEIESMQRDLDNLLFS